MPALTLGRQWWARVPPWRGGWSSCSNENDRMPLDVADAMTSSRALVEGDGPMVVAPALPDVTATKFRIVFQHGDIDIWIERSSENAARVARTPGVPGLVAAVGEGPTTHWIW